MRLATWNCRQSIDRKRHAIEALRADILVIPECAAAPALAGELGASFLWSGDNPVKGLAIVGLNGWTVKPLDALTQLPWVLPVAVFDPRGAHIANLLGVWPVQRRDGRPGYAGQIASVLAAWAQELAAGNTIVAGDFNCSLQGTVTAGHRSNLTCLRELGLESSYHVTTSLEHGAETAMTLTWIGKGRTRLGYHCDFVFLPQAMLARLKRTEVGWESPQDVTLSDHLPVLVELSA